MRILRWLGYALRYQLVSGPRAATACLCLCLFGAVSEGNVATAAPVGSRSLGIPVAVWDPQAVGMSFSFVPVGYLRPPPLREPANGDHGAFLIPAAPPPFLWWYTTRALRVVLGLSVGFLGLSEATSDPSYIHWGGTVLALGALIIIPTAFVADSMFMYLTDRAATLLLLF